MEKLQIDSSRYFEDDGLVGAYIDNSWQVITRREADEKGVADEHPVYYDFKLKRHLVLIDGDLLEV